MGMVRECDEPILKQSGSRWEGKGKEVPLALVKLAYKAVDKRDVGAAPCRKIRERSNIVRKGKTDL